MPKKNDQLTFLTNQLKEKRNNAKLFPLWKKTLIHEKERIRALEIRMPITDIIQGLEDIRFQLTLTNNDYLKNVLNKSNRDHYILGKITLKDKIEYYRVIEDILNNIKNQKREAKKRSKKIF